ncbi:hypothetical protein MUN88_10380 [Gracilibacillus caseinilyticus]|uniref:Uncharacterized protein n=1 Tax=Gracilibacillus caseinilyticus TaxID=2932256 RepID=A0ABY4F162_9BACI|nr:hypothetical protein [Gracilibacillus caseinilyticus]UOQ50422.1 hypothetical protein MUN88_10380 [Gracilibacillus caseinilyticus]
MLTILLILTLSIFLLYFEWKYLSKPKEQQDRIFLIIFMSVAVVLLSLHFFDVQLPYFTDIISMIFDPISAPLSKWLESLQKQP